MFRFVVATYLMIVTAAGPAACCCTLSRLATPHPFPSSLPASSPSCCHHPVPINKPAPSHEPATPGCPCPQGSECKAIALPQTLDPTLESAEAQFHFLPALLADQVVSQTCPWFVSRPDVPLSPGISTADLLNTFHMLRC